MHIEILSMPTWGQIMQSISGRRCLHSKRILNFIAHVAMDFSEGVGVENIRGAGCGVADFIVGLIELSSGRPTGQLARFYRTAECVCIFHGELRGISGIFKFIILNSD